MQQTELFVIHHFEYVGVAVDHQAYTVFAEKFFHTRGPTSRVTAYVRHQHLHILDRKNVEFGALATHHAGVYIAGHGADGWHNVGQPLYYIVVSHVAGMPHLVAIGKMDCKPVVPHAVGIAEYANPFHGL